MRSRKDPIRASLCRTRSVLSTLTEQEEEPQRINKPSHILLLGALEPYSVSEIMAISPYLKLYVWMWIKTHTR